MSEKPRKTPTISSTTHSLPKNLREGFIPDTSEDKESFVLENVRKYNDCVFQAFEVSQGSLTIQGIFLEKIALMEENPKEFLKQYLQHVPPADPETMYEINNVIHFDTEVTEPLKLELMNRLLARYTGKHPKSSGSSTGTEAIALRVRTSMEEVLRKIQQAYRAEKMLDIETKDVMKALVTQELSFIPLEILGALADFYDVDYKTELRRKMIERRLRAYNGSQFGHIYLNPQFEKRTQRFDPRITSIMREVRQFCQLHGKEVLHLSQAIEYYNACCVRNGKEEECIPLP